MYGNGVNDNQNLCVYIHVGAYKKGKLLFLKKKMRCELIENESFIVKPLQLNDMSWGIKGRELYSGKQLVSQVIKEEECNVLLSFLGGK